MTFCKARLTVERRKYDGANVASELFASYPLRLHLTESQFQEALLCYLLGYGGGLVSGDSVALTISVKPKASAVLTSQSTSKAFCARPDRPPTELKTHLTVEEDALLVWVPQPLQCFAKSQLEQSTLVDLKSPKSSLLLLDWYTGGRRNHDDGGWQMDWFKTTTFVRDCSDNLCLRDATRLSGGLALQRHMGQYHVVAMMALMGPQVKELACRMKEQFSTRHSYDEHKDEENEPRGRNTHGLTVSCGTFPYAGDDEGGVLVRVLSTSVENAASFFSQHVGTLEGKLKDDPFHEILVLQAGSIGPLQSQDPAEKIEPRDTSLSLSGDLMSSSWNQSAQSTASDEDSESMRQQSSSTPMVYQLVDSSTPTGGFAHSNTVEVACQFGFFTADTLLHYCWNVLLQTITTTLPFIEGSYKAFRAAGDHNKALQDWELMDQYLSACLTSHVSRRASCVQGSGMLRAFSACFPQIRPIVQQLKRSAKRRNGGHGPTCFGAICGLLRLPSQQAISMFLYCTARDLVNAAVRMNLVGPLEGAGLTQVLCQSTEQLLREEGHEILHWKDAHQVSPVIETLANAHDRLYTRLFNS